MPATILQKTRRTKLAIYKKEKELKKLSRKADTLEKENKKLQKEVDDLKKDKDKGKK